MATRLTSIEVNKRLVNLRFELVSEYKNRRTKCSIRCHCGNIFEQRPELIFNKKVSSCGCLKPKGPRKNISNNKYNRLLAIESTDSINKSGSVIWKFLCDCSNICYLPLNSVKFGSTKSCGCLNIEKSTERLRKLQKFQIGKNHPSYKGDSIDRASRRCLPEEILWRKEVYKKDNHTCQICYKKNCMINAHHMYSWKDYPELRFDVNNGVTLCAECHTKFHKMFGYGKNTKEQFIEYKNG